jgi:hypothetical protein
MAAVLAILGAILAGCALYALWPWLRDPREALGRPSGATLSARTAADGDLPIRPDWLSARDCDAVAVLVPVGAYREPARERRIALTTSSLPRAFGLLAWRATRRTLELAAAVAWSLVTLSLFLFVAGVPLAVVASALLASIR